MAIRKYYRHRGRNPRYHAMARIRRASSPEVLKPPNVRGCTEQRRSWMVVVVAPTQPLADSKEAAWGGQESERDMTLSPQGRLEKLEAWFAGLKRRSSDRGSSVRFAGVWYGLKWFDFRSKWRVRACQDFSDCRRD